MVGLDRDKVLLQPYNEDWAKEYEKEKDLLVNILKGIKCQIEHVGSTSIKGLSAKPIIDIAIGTDDVETVIKIGDILAKQGYDVENQLETKGEIFVGKGETTCRTHYIHIQEIGSTYWNNFMYFKTYLLNHPETVKEYEILKKELSVKYQDDRKKYTASKNEFISSVLEKAKKMYKL